MVGSTSAATERAFGTLFAPYIADESNAFVVSSDFCHWGSRFGYTYYIPSSPSPAVTKLPLPGAGEIEADGLDKGHNLSSRDKSPKKPQIHESIAHMDFACMEAVCTGSHANFLDVLKQTGNTVCGRHPIGVVMAGLEAVLSEETGKGKEDARGRCRFVRYERSGDVKSPGESSVSYVSGFAVL